MPLVSFHTPRKHRKTIEFLGDIETDQWHEMGQSRKCFKKYWHHQSVIFLFLKVNLTCTSNDVIKLKNIINFLIPNRVADVVWTSHRRSNDVVCLLGWDSYERFMDKQFTMSLIACVHAKRQCSIKFLPRSRSILSSSLSRLTFSRSFNIYDIP